MASGDTKTESYLRTAAEGTRADLPSDNCCDTKTQNLIVGVANRIMDVEDEVEELKNNPDVVDIVDTYQDLQNYDTSTLTDKDIIRVLQDSTHSGNSTYYRWNATTNQFDFVGEITGGGGGDTVYSTKTTSISSEGGAVYIGNLNASQEEQTDPTTTDNHYRYFYALPYENLTSTNAPKNGSINILGDCKGESSVVLGLSASDAKASYYQTVIGQGAHSSNNATIAIGLNAGVSAENSVAIGRNTTIDASQNRNSVALGSFAKPTRSGEVNIGTNGNNQGYNSTDYRVIGGVHDPVDAHDAATKGYVDANAGGVKTLTSADYNFPANNPNLIAPWLLPPGQYITAPHTKVMPDGNSSTYNSGQPISLLVLNQANGADSTYGCFIFTDNFDNKLFKVQYNGTPISGYPHDI